MKRLFLVLGILLWSLPAWATTYPACPTGSPTSCTLTVHITSSATPVFDKLAIRQFLFLQNTGYTIDNPPVVTQHPIFCAIGSVNNPTSSNWFVIQPGSTFVPYQLVAPQTSFRVPAGDVSCIAPLGDAYLSAEEE